MDEVPIVGREDEARLFQLFQAQYDAPAFVRRARQVQQAYDELIVRCLKQRDEWLTFVRLRLGVLKGLLGEWDCLRTHRASDEPIRVLRRLDEELQPRLRVPVEPTSSARTIRRACRELTESVDHFNRRWRTFLAEVDLAPVNELRDGYNRYYVLEKECVVRSPRIARQGFERLEPLTHIDLFERLPLLPDLTSYSSSIFKV